MNSHDQADLSLTHDPVMSEQRRAARNKVRIAGEINLSDNSRPMHCRIVNMSATGARIYVCPEQRRRYSSTGGYTEHLGLYLDHRCTCVECKVVWCSDEEIGVQFCSPFLNTRGNA